MAALTYMPAVYIYECAACDARFSMIMPEPPPETQPCIHCFAKGARVVCKEGEQEGDLHRFPSKTKILEGATPIRKRKPARKLK
jgi:hypothetical protein